MYLSNRAVMVGRGSPANQMLTGETDGLALSFVDSFFHGRTSHYGSARVKDTGTPANNYNSHPFGLLTYSASKKWVRGPNGLWFLSDFAADLPFEWGENGSLFGIVVEPQAQSRALRARRLDDAMFWTATNISTSAVEGIDGVTGSATRITATADGGTILGSANTLSSRALRLAPFIRRVSGTGNLEWTLDGGATWTAFQEEITSSFKRIGVGATVANPRIGFRISSNGDAFDIDFANGEDGAFDTSPLESTDSHVTRAADVIELDKSKFRYDEVEGLLYVRARWDDTIINNPIGPRLDNDTSNGATTGSTDYIGFDRFSSGFGVRARAGGVTILNAEFLPTSGEPDTTTFHKLALAYKEDDYAYVWNGGTVGTLNSGAVPGSAIKRLFLGSSSVVHIAEVIYLPRRPTNTGMQDMTDL